MKRMLINATHPEEVRVALVDGFHLYDLDIEHQSREQKKSNIYKGRVSRVEPSLEAAFIDYGSEKHGFLPLKEIAREYFYRDPRDANGRLSIREVIKEGQEIIVQVDKEERGNKGAALTSFISLAGRYLVLMPNNPRAGGISRRIEGDERSELREVMAKLNIPEEMGVIIRTAGVGRSHEELQWDMEYLMQLWTAIKTSTDDRSAPFLIYQESNVVIRAIRDCLRQDIEEVLLDTATTYEEALHFIRLVMPQYESRLKLYSDKKPLFTSFQIENQIETAFQREVKLPSGGSIVIDVTEALISIDINSSRSTKGADIEETALLTNMEAVDEIARQLRLRDIGGLIVVDFIDMMPTRNQRDVENKMKDALELDRARIQLGRISRFGLMELSRQRLRPSLGETSGKVCPRCSGTGMIRDLHSFSLSILRILEEEAMKETTGEIHAQLPIDVATYLLNEKRARINEIEIQHKVRILLIPNLNLESPHFEINRLRITDRGNTISYDLVRSMENKVKAEILFAQEAFQPQEAAVKMLQHTTPPPQKSQIETGTTLQRFSTWFGSLFKSDVTHNIAQRKERQQEETEENNGKNSSGINNSGVKQEYRSSHQGGGHHRQGQQRLPYKDQANRDNNRDNNRDSTRDNTPRDNTFRDNNREPQHDNKRPRFQENKPYQLTNNQTEEKDFAKNPDENQGRDRFGNDRNNRRRRGGRRDERFDRSDKDKPLIDNITQATDMPPLQISEPLSNESVANTAQADDYYPHPDDVSEGSREWRSDEKPNNKRRDRHPRHQTQNYENNSGADEAASSQTSTALLSEKANTPEKTSATEYEKRDRFANNEHLTPPTTSAQNENRKEPIATKTVTHSDLTERSKDLENAPEPSQEASEAAQEKQPRDRQPRDRQPRDRQPRDRQPRDEQPIERAPTDRQIKTQEAQNINEPAIAKVEATKSETTIKPLISSLEILPPAPMIKREPREKKGRAANDPRELKKKQKQNLNLHTEKVIVEKTIAEKPVLEKIAVDKLEKASVEKASVEKTPIEKPTIEEKSIIEKKIAEKPAEEESSLSHNNAHTEVLTAEATNVSVITEAKE